MAIKFKIIFKQNVQNKWLKEIDAFHFSCSKNQNERDAESIRMIQQSKKQFETVYKGNR